MADWMGWHFSDTTECLRYGDGRKIAVGVTHTVDCKPVLCESGLHASAYVLDALQYAPGPILWRVSLSGKILNGRDKSCATRRTYHARLDATNVLQDFARKCALDVIHLWSAPNIVREYLETGKEELRTDAYEAASNAAISAAKAAASNVAISAAKAAASNAAINAACYASSSDGRIAASDAASNAAINAAYYAAWTVDRSAEWSKNSAVWAAQCAVLEKMVTAAVGG